jgi:hypothetical protein
MAQTLEKQSSDGWHVIRAEPIKPTQLCFTLCVCEVILCVLCVMSAYLVQLNNFRSVIYYFEVCFNDRLIATPF